MAVTEFVALLRGSLTQCFNQLSYLSTPGEWEELAFDDPVKYRQWDMDCSTAKCYDSDRIRTPFPRASLSQLGYLATS